MTRRARTGAACALALLLLVPACSADEPERAGPGDPPSTSPPVGSSSAPPSSSGSSSTPPTPEPVLTLTGAPFSGYVDVTQDVLPWRLACPEPDGAPVPDAVTMGTAEQDLLDDGSASTTRQVAVFASPDAASAAADQLAAHAREQCEGEVEAEPGFVVSTTTVEVLDVGTQGLLVDTVAEDGAAATAVLRRGNAVALVQAVAAPEYLEGRTVTEDVRTGAREVYEQLCGYEQAGC